MAARRVIVIKQGEGPSFTPKGQNLDIIMWKMYAFKATWEGYKEHHDPSQVTRPTRVPEAYEAAWTDVKDLYNTRDKLAWAVKIEDAGYDLLKCTEAEIGAFVDGRLFGESSNVRRIHTVHNYCSEIRDMFRMIGREHAWGNGEILRDMTEELGESSNPMSPAKEAGFVKKLEKKLAEEQLQSGNSKPRGSEAAEKHGPPISVVIAIAFMMYFLAKLVGDFQRWTRGKLRDVRPLENLANLVFLAAVLLHEAPRPGEIFEKLSHTHLFTALHTKVYWLTFVFIKPSTWAWLVTTNAISHIFCGFYKGKDKQFVQYRVKSVIPTAYNSIDLLNIYVICMRILVCLNPASIIPTSVFKQNLNIFSLRHRLTKSTLFRFIRFYSWRYGAAEEDKKDKTVKEEWTRQRMGHSDTSDMKDKYADNDGTRPVVGEDVLPLGMDIYSRASNPNVIPLEFKVVSTGVVYDTTWLEKAFNSPNAPEGAQEDFENALALVTRFVENDDEAAKAELMEMFTSKDWMSSMPFGFNYVLPSHLGSKALFEVIDESRSTLEKAFDTVPTPKAVPEIWSIPMLLYGNLRNLLGLSVVPPEPFVELPPPSDPASTSAPPSTSRKRHQEEPTEEAGEQEHDEDGWDGERFTDLDVGNIVAIKSNSPSDPTTFKVPNLDPPQYIWLAKMTKSVEVTNKKTIIKRGRFTGRFLFNEARDLASPNFSIRARAETIAIPETALVEVYEDDPATFHLTSEDIQVISDFLATHT